MHRVIAIILILIALPGWSFCQTTSYNPLDISDTVKVRLIERTVVDGARQRDIPLRIYLPQDKSPAPVILFSHGLGGSGREYAYLGEHWSRRGYVAVFLQHKGSDTSVWQDKSPANRLDSLRNAANFDNFLLRVKDASIILDQLGILNKTKDDALEGRVDLSRVGMSGHSFGAITTQALSGQNTGFPDLSFTDRRISAAVIMSPTSPLQISPAQSFGSVRIPWMIMTGTHDLVPELGQSDMATRLAVFPALPAGNKYELVLNDAEHSVFTDRVLPGDSKPRNPCHHRSILALSTAFWDSYLKNNGAARGWLSGDGSRTLIENNDKWTTK